MKLSQTFPPLSHLLYNECRTIQPVLKSTKDSHDAHRQSDKRNVGEIITCVPHIKLWRTI